MKAIRKTDGKCIEVKEWRGSSDVIYSTLDMNEFYQPSDLDFNLPEEKKSAVIEGWVCRDKSGCLVLHYKKPHRTFGGSRWYSAQSQKSLPGDLFPSLTGESEPLKVRIQITPTE